MPLPRAQGQVRVSARAREQRTVLDRLYQQGSSKALMPRGDGAGLTVVLLNTAGGITGGDRFKTEVQTGASTRVTLTTQASERVYRARAGETGTVATHLQADDGAILHWLPQETILYDRAALSRNLDVALGKNATFLAVESFILGRAASNETVRNLHLSDRWRVRRDGKLIYADALRIHGDAAELTSGPATLNGHRAFASVLLVAPDADRHLIRLRELVDSIGGAGLIRDGVLAARLIAPNGFTLRKTLIPVLETLRGAPLPRPWSI